MAGYNRSTFYLYFQDIYALADAAENDILQMLEQNINNIIRQEPELYLPDLMLKFAEDAVRYAQYIYLFSDSKSFKTKFMQMVRQTLSQIIDDNSSNLHSVKDFDFIVSFIFTMILHNISYYYQQDKEMNLQEKIALCQQIVMPGLQQLIQPVKFN